MGQIITPTNRLIWLQLRRNIRDNLMKTQQAKWARCYAVLMMAEESYVLEHVFDCVTGIQNIVMDREKTPREMIEFFKEIGWEEKEIPTEDQQERKDYYDSLFGGGTMH